MIRYIIGNTLPRRPGELGRMDVSSIRGDETSPPPNEPTENNSPHRAAVGLSIIAAALLPNCFGPAMPAMDGTIIELRRSARSISPGAQGYQNTLQVYWFGAGCHVLRLGDASVLTDPFVSNGASLLFPKSDRDLVNQTLGLLDAPDAIIVNHGHHDHILDAWRAMNLDGWANVPLHGGKTTCNILAGWKERSIEDRCHGIGKNGETIILPSGPSAKSVRLTAYPGVHGPHLGCCFTAFDGNVKTPRTTPPNSIADYRSGEVFNYLIEIGGFKVFYMGGIGAPEMTPEIPGGVDVVILCAPGTQNIDRGYPEIPLSNLGPRHVIIGHHNSFLMDDPDQRLAIAGKDISHVDLLSRKVQQHYRDNPGDKRFEKIWIPPVTVMESKGRARNVILIRKSKS
jgi:L-ascorbate metabolism protein UlaG (beta-lactamase superfamily)